MPPNIEKIREGQALTLGRNPQFTKEVVLALMEPPRLPTDGVAITDNVEPILGLLGVQPQKVIGRRDGQVYITTLDDTATYTLELNSNPYVYVAQPGDTEREVFEGLVAAEAGTESTSVALNVATDDDGVVYLELTGVLGQTFTVTAVGSAGAAMEATLDALSVTWTLYAYHRSVGWWRVPNSTETVGETSLDRYEISGIERLYIRIEATDGRVVSYYGICELED